VTVLTQRMREELVRRNYAETTIRAYLMAIEEFRRYAKKRLDHLGPEDIRGYQVALLEGKKLAIGTVALRVSALRFFYLKVLKKRALRDELPYPKHPKWSRRLPTILTPEEMTRLINSAKNLFHYAMLLTMYSAGLRRSELCRLKVSNIDSQRMVIRVERGKGDVDREIPLSQKLLETLRTYWRWMRPKTYLFPGTENGWRADKPITPKVIWEAVQEASKRAGIAKHVTPHTLRHCFASHLLESGTDLRTIQVLMGHRDIEATTRYLHVSPKHLRVAVNPIEQIPVSGPANLKRSRKLRKPE
jgi:integrase/recombinase XerD